jgi:hypothetical protein
LGATGALGGPGSARSRRIAFRLLPDIRPRSVSQITLAVDRRVAC